MKGILYGAICAANDDIPMDIYISDPGLTVAYRGIGREGTSHAPIIIHAPEGSPAEAYVTETSGSIDARIEFMIWDKPAD